MGTQDLIDDPCGNKYDVPGINLVEIEKRRQDLDETGSEKEAHDSVGSDAGKKVSHLICATRLRRIRPRSLAEIVDKWQLLIKK